MEDRFLDFVADILEVEREDVSLDIVYNEFPGWDSLMMMRMIMEIEEEFDVTIPIENATKISNLRDLYKMVEA